MKGLFPQFEDASEKDYSKIWSEALFVFDTNVLLDLYRYQEATRDELIEVIEKIGSKIWIPYQVAVEFQRNRKKVILDQDKKFKGVANVVDGARKQLTDGLEKLDLEKRHSVINVHPFVKNFEEAANSFLADLAELREKQRDRTDPDLLKRKIESLFDGRVGEAPADQTAIDEIYLEGKQRFDADLPPGFLDKYKEDGKDDSSRYIHNGIRYQKMFGDLLVWRQTLAHAKVSHVTCLIFVTGESGKDWWRIIDSDGPKKIGPRTELVEEAFTQSGIEVFLMYNPESFLTHAKKMLNARVSEATLVEVRDVAAVRAFTSDQVSQALDNYSKVEESVLFWASEYFPNVAANKRGFPDLIGSQGSVRHGFEIVYLKGIFRTASRVAEIIFKASYEIKLKHFAGISVVVAVDTEFETDKIVAILSRALPRIEVEGIRVVLGTFDPSADPENAFTPFRDVAVDRLVSGGRDDRNETAELE